MFFSCVTATVFVFFCWSQTFSSLWNLCRMELHFACHDSSFLVSECLWSATLDVVEKVQHRLSFFFLKPTTFPVLVCAECHAERGWEGARHNTSNQKSNLPKMCFSNFKLFSTHFNPMLQAPLTCCAGKSSSWASRAGATYAQIELKVLLWCLH